MAKHFLAKTVKLAMLYFSAAYALSTIRIS